MTNMSEHSPAEPPSLYLHCGAYKTGTSSIQGFFSIHREELVGKFGLLYPLTARRTNSGIILPGQAKDACYGHHQLAHFGYKELGTSKSQSRELRDLLESVKQEFAKSGAHSLFISTELLTSLGGRVRRIILTEFAGFRIQVIYCVRQPGDYIESMNNQILRGGATALYSNGPLPFLRNLDAWADAIGRENVRVLTFSPKRFSAYAREFFDIPGIEGLADFAVPRLPRLNSSTSLEGITVRSFLGRHLPHRSTLSPKKRHHFDLLIGEIDEALSRRTPLVTLSQEDRRKIDEANDAAMQEIVARYLTPASAEFLLASGSSRPDSPKNLGQPCHYTQGDVRMILEKLTEWRVIRAQSAEAVLRTLDGADGESAAATLLSNHDLERIIAELPVRKRGGSTAKVEANRNPVHLIAKKFKKRVQTNAIDAAASGLFRLMKSNGPVFRHLPKSVCVRLAGFLSRKGYHAQALTLNPDPLGEAFLRAGIHAPFNQHHPAFSEDFTLAQGIAWLGSHPGSLPHGRVLAKWIARLPESGKEPALAFLCQIGFENFKLLLSAIKPTHPVPRWLSDRLAPTRKPVPVSYKDLNQNLLTFNQLKRAGRDSEAATLLIEAFANLNLPPPPARLFNGYSPARPALASASESKLPKVSVVLCAWNAAEFLPVALASILGQTYPNLEIIAIDDGSTDGTFDVLKQWLGDWPDAVIIHQAENRGAYACRNEGMERATGEYVTFHDADDWSAPEKIERQWKAIASTPNALASSSDWFRIDSRTGLCFTRRVFPFCRWNCSSFMFHRGKALEVLGFYDVVRTGADSEYVARFEAVFGPHRHVRVKLPLSIGLEHNASLTGDSESGFDKNGLSQQRQAYLESWRRWHAARWNCPDGLRLSKNQTIGELLRTL